MIKKNWYEDDNVIELVVSSMNTHFPRPKRSSGISYTDIATKWCKFMPFYCYSKKHWEHGPYGMQLNITDMRKSFPYQYNNKKQRWFDWFTVNFPIWSVQRLGNQFIGNTNMIPLIPLEWILKNAEPAEVKLALDQSLMDTTEYHTGDILIDLLNLERYIASTERKLQSTKNNPKYNKNYTDKLSRNLQDAIILQKLALANDDVLVRKLDGYRLWQIPHYTKTHHWGRTYGVGAYNLQYMNSQVREAAMGTGYVVDLNSSVFMFYKTLADGAGVPSAVLTELQDSKVQFRAELAECLNNTSGSDEFKQKLIKEAITSLGFGAKDDNFGSLIKIIRNKDDFAALKAHPKWCELTNCIAGVTSYMRSEYADEIEDFKKTEPGRFSMRKFMAMFYQRYETAIMKEVWDELEQSGREPWLGLHDGIMCKHRPDLANIQNIVGELNPNASLELKKIDKYFDVDVDYIKTQEESHAERMAQQQDQAKQWASEQGIKTKSALENMSEINPVLAMQMMLKENELFNSDWDDDFHAGPNTW